MKKIIALLLVLVFAFSVGCSGAGELSSSSDNQSQTSSSITSTSVSDDADSDENPEIESSTNNNSKTAYESITCFEPVEFKEVYFSFSEDKDALALSVPKEWSLRKSGDIFEIIRSNNVIGTVCSGTAKITSGAKSVYKKDLHSTNLHIVHNIYEYSKNGMAKFEHVFNYKYYNEDKEIKNISIKTDYSEISSTSADRIIKQAKTTTAWSKDNIGVLKLNDTRKKILILGNSFVRSSRIGETLTEMCAGDYVVDASAINNAGVHTYANDATWVNKISSGQYSAVFMCGFYASDNAVGHFKTIVDACKSSQTKLAIFPAHNENVHTINKAATDYPDIVLLNWKAEIEMLISSGVASSNFCIDDYHQHSTPLAGFVGAHMIYRAIYDKMPKSEGITYTNVTAAQINRLGKYTTKCSKALVDTNKLYCFD